MATKNIGAGAGAPTLPVASSRMQLAEHGGPGRVLSLPHRQISVDGFSLAKTSAMCLT